MNTPLNPPNSTILMIVSFFLTQRIRDCVVLNRIYPRTMELTSENTSPVWSTGEAGFVRSK